MGEDSNTAPATSGSGRCYRGRGALGVLRKFVASGVGNNLTEPLYYVGDFTENKTCRRWPPNSIVDQAHLTRRVTRSKRSRELFR
jgi:hypothetical protein